MRKNKLENSKHSINNKNQKKMGKIVEGIKIGSSDKSLVKYGLEEISDALFRPTYKHKFDVFKFLSCTHFLIYNN